MTRTLTFKIDGKRYVACVDDWTMEIKDLKRNQAVEAFDDDGLGCWVIWFELADNHQLEVRFKIEDGERTFKQVGAVEFDEDGIIIEDYDVEMKIK